MEAQAKIASQFRIEGAVTEVRPLGNGNINDTFLVRTDGPDAYVLQRINNAVFKDVALLQHNIELVTSHMRAKLQKAGESDIARKVLTPIPLKDSAKTYFETQDGKFWRMTLLIKDSFTLEEVTPHSSYDAGRAFGRFEDMLSDLPEALGETIPDFHNMELRSRQFADAIAADAAGRMADPEVKELVAFLQEHDYEMCKAERMYREGILPKRICHCDTKVNNMLFDADGNVLCVIDLDTTMPGFVFSDFGDFMRTAANAVAEDDPDISKVAFRMEIFEAFTRGYLQSAAFLTDVERENLPYAAQLFPYMQAVRFLTDYINGDTYYKIAYPEHNLVRTRNQVALFKSVSSHLPQMQEFIAGISLKQ